MGATDVGADAAYDAGPLELDASSTSRSKDCRKLGSFESSGRVRMVTGGAIGACDDSPFCIANAASSSVRRVRGRFNLR